MAGVPIQQPVDGRQLQPIVRDPVPAARFALPGPVLSLDQLRELMRR